MELHDQSVYALSLQYFAVIGGQLVMQWGTQLATQ